MKNPGVDSQSRKASKSRALLAATRVSESCMGVALLKNHVDEDRIHLGKIRTLEKENRSIQTDLEHQRLQFLKRRMGTPGPLLIMEQTRIPDAILDGEEEEGRIVKGKSLGRGKSKGKGGKVVRGKGGAGNDTPGYMKPTQSSGRIICPTSTIGAFRLTPKTKLEVQNSLSTQRATFRSVVMPSFPLSETELRQLRAILLRNVWTRRLQDHTQSPKDGEGSSDGKKKAVSQGRQSTATHGTSDPDGKTGSEETEEKQTEQIGRDRSMLRLPMILSTNSIFVTNDEDNPLPRKRSSFSNSDWKKSYSEIRVPLGTNFNSLSYSSKEGHSEHPLLSTGWNTTDFNWKMTEGKSQRQAIQGNYRQSVSTETNVFFGSNKSKTELETRRSSNKPISNQDPIRKERHPLFVNSDDPDLSDHKTASGDDALQEMTSFPKSQKIVRNVSFHDDVIKQSSMHRSQKAEIE